MIEDNFSKDANKDFPSITNTHFGFVASCSGTLILIDLDGSAYRHQFLADLWQ
jgi:hypothetical protein